MRLARRVWSPPLVLISASLAHCSSSTGTPTKDDASSVDGRADAVLTDRDAHVRDGKGDPSIDAPAPDAPSSDASSSDATPSPPLVLA